MKECSKSIMRRLRDPNFANRFFVGSGLDIGGAPDPLGLYIELFPRLRGVRTYDKEDGDAQHLEGIEDGSMEFVHSSHCLEHMADPAEALGNWFRSVKEGGHLIVTVPDAGLSCAPTGAIAPKTNRMAVKANSLECRMPWFPPFRFRVDFP